MKSNINFRTSYTNSKLKLYGHQLYQPYQFDGLKWLLSREITSYPRGGLLSDEMGLGKTIQIIALIMANPLPYTLIILPPNLISQWKLQFTKFAPFINVIIHHSKSYLSNTHFNTQKPIVCLTSFYYSSSFRIHSHKWDRLVVDEAHMIRNPKSKRFKSIYNIYSKIRWAITGTPIQNSFKDFITIAIFLRISTRNIRSNIDSIKLKYILRRTKHSLITFNSTFILPKLNIHNIFVDFLSEKELLFYNKVAGSIIKQHSHYNFRDVLPFELSLRLRQASILPQLVIDGYKKKWNLNFIDWQYTNTKLDTIIKHIHSSNHQAIIFTHFKQEIAYLKNNIQHRSIHIYDGSISNKQKNNIILLANNKLIDILIIQIQSGSTGLNLQTFNHIYFTSPSWNPAIDLQAIARTHRIGQTKQVHIHNVYINNTIDKRILDIQKHKLQIINLLLQ